MSSRFDFNDLILFHKIINNDIPVILPSYIKPFDGNSRLRSTHLDELSYVSSIIPKSSTTNLLDKSFFYRTHSLWNKLPFEIRSLKSRSLFRTRLESHIWHCLLLYDESTEITQVVGPLAQRSFPFSFSHQQYLFPSWIVSPGQRWVGMFWTNLFRYMGYCKW